MKTRNIAVISLIGVLFIGTIFFSGCVNKSTQGSITCSDFCEAKGKDSGKCSHFNSLSTPHCSSGTCYYGLEYFDIEEYDISCNEFDTGCRINPFGGLTSEKCNFCACLNLEQCNSESHTCEDFCNEQGCNLSDVPLHELVE